MVVPSLLPWWDFRFSSGCLVMSLYSHAFILLHARCTTSLAVVTRGKKMKKQCNCVPDLNSPLFKPSLVSSGERQSYAPITVRVRICGVAGLVLETKKFQTCLWRVSSAHFQGHGGYFSIRKRNQFSRCFNHLKHVCTCLPYIRIFSAWLCQGNMHCLSSTDMG